MLAIKFSRLDLNLPLLPVTPWASATRRAAQFACWLAELSRARELSLESRFQTFKH
jgi:hypothetical protein